MKFKLDNIEIEHIENSHPISVRLSKVDFNFAHIVLKVDMASILSAEEALNADEVPKSIKFGSLFRGHRFCFSKQQTTFYKGSLQKWLFPFSFKWEPRHSYKKSEVINLVNYFAALHRAC